MRSARSVDKVQTLSFVEAGCARHMSSYRIWALALFAQRINNLKSMGSKQSSACSFEAWWVDS